MRLKLNPEEVRRLLRYDPGTGSLFWRVSAAQKRPGEKAGFTCKRTGYVLVCINKTVYLGHRLAWLIHFGNWPQQIDHRNLDRGDNSIGNLREATSLQNNVNKRAQKNCKSGFKGVTRIDKTNRWRAVIGVGGKMRHLGCFATKEIASEAYLRAAKELYGEFARAA